MACTVMVAVQLTDSVKSQVAPVLVPLPVPRSSTVEPGRASPCAPSTRPVTVTFWAWASNPQLKKSRRKSSA